MQRARIQIVEDEAVIALELKNSLLELGHEVVAMATSGEQAVTKAATCNPELILMDIRLKGKIDGIEAAGVIRSQFRIPIIFLTAYLDEERLDQAKLTMPFGYLLKPIQERELKVTIEMALYLAKADAERIKWEQSLFESEKRYRTLLLNIGVLVSELDEQGKYTYVNERYECILGFKPTELIGQQAVTFIHPEDLAQSIARYSTLLQKETPTKDIWRFRHKDGHYIRFECSGTVYNAENGTKKTIVVAQELTD